MKESYLFVDVTASTADDLISYAHLGGFKSLVVYDGTWNSSEGSYLINTISFPPSSTTGNLKAVSEKIRKSGLKFGMHSFVEVAVSNNDPLLSSWLPLTDFDDVRILV
jgi:hypothetical protein